VARFSYELGQLASTIRLKNASDEDVERGVAMKKAWDDAAEETRLWTRDERKAAIQAVLDRGKFGVTAAIEVAAEENPGRGSPKAFERDWYKKDP